ncbi:MAG: penicillin-binding transpeptidase domain-containing protein, partial [Candidatus Liptonbacteria bacterium]
TPGQGNARSALLNDPNRPLFDRMVSGEYNPGSTIKPLVGVAALTENIVTPDFSVFSPGYLDVQNPYNPSNPSRFLDWRYQGYINLYSALAQSSNVYFYTVGGGANGVKGLGLDRLHSWWEKFGLGKLTGIDLPREGDGFLPTAEWKQRASGRPWLLGDTYNVSIGQGDLSVTPLQLLSYIGAIANGGKILMPHVGSTVEGKVNEDLTSLLPQITEVQKGMRATVTNRLGTAYTLNNLSFQVSAKTGSAQVKNNTEENAFFVGYAPSDNPQIAILVLVENSKAGSLNAVPIAKDVLNWYYEHRLK